MPLRSYYDARHCQEDENRVLFEVLVSFTFLFMHLKLTKSILHLCLQLLLVRASYHTVCGIMPSSGTSGDHCDPSPGILSQ